MTGRLGTVEAGYRAHEIAASVDDRLAGAGIAHVVQKIKREVALRETACVLIR